MDAASTHEMRNRKIKLTELKERQLKTDSANTLEDLV